LKGRYGYEYTLAQLLNVDHKYLVSEAESMSNCGLKYLPFFVWTAIDLLATWNMDYGWISISGIHFAVQPDSMFQIKKRPFDITIIG